MSARSFIVLLHFLVFAGTAQAHRLNEYLQATTISLSQDSVVLHLQLTAGTSLAPGILKEIDRNGDGIFAPEEEQRYVMHILQDILVTIDGRGQATDLLGFSFPGAEALLDGTGTIAINLAIGRVMQDGRHELILRHAVRHPDNVYLVNCLVPADSSIRISRQERNPDQSVYQLVFLTGKNLSAQDVEEKNPDKTNDWAVVKTYFIHGVGHILTGYDHLLFLCALVLGAVGFWDLFKVVTAFTIAHSITLTLAVLHLLVVPSSVVEPVISASIVFVAIQNIFRPKQAQGNSRLIVAFVFGLFHGLGFAGALALLMHQMPVRALLFAIAGFSAGIEAGNQVVLLPLFGLLTLLQNRKTTTPVVATTQPVLLRIGSIVIALSGLYYFIMSVSS